MIFQCPAADPSGRATLLVYENQRRGTPILGWSSQFLVLTDPHAWTIEVRGTAACSLARARSNRMAATGERCVERMYSRTGILWALKARAGDGWVVLAVDARGGREARRGEGSAEARRGGGSAAAACAVACAHVCLAWPEVSHVCADELLSFRESSAVTVRRWSCPGQSGNGKMHGARRAARRLTQTAGRTRSTLAGASNGTAPDTAYAWT